MSNALRQSRSDVRGKGFGESLDKGRSTGFFSTLYEPVKSHENVSISWAKFEAHYTPPLSTRVTKLFSILYLV